MLSNCLVHIITHTHTAPCVLHLHEICLAQLSLKLKKLVGISVLGTEAPNSTRMETLGRFGIKTVHKHWTRSAIAHRSEVPETGCYSITPISQVQELILDQLRLSLMAAVAAILVTCYISCRLSQKWLFFFFFFWTLE